MKAGKNKLFLLPAFISLSAAGFLYLVLSCLGFPDGHPTELDKALHLFCRISIPISLVFAIGFAYLSFAASPSEKWKSLLLYGFVICVLTGIVIYYFLAGTCENGTGG